MSELEQHYKGHRYNVEANETLYNAFVIQNYFASGGKLRNYFAESGGTGILLRSLNQQAISDLRIYLDLLSDPAKKVQMFTDEITMPKDWEKLQKDFKQNCFDAGYLTIAEARGDKLELKVPNMEVFDNMQQLLKSFLGKNDQFGDVLNSFIEARFDDFFEALEELSFKDKTFINIASKNQRIRNDANYEPLLHTILLMAMRLTLEEGQKNNHIANFTIKNKKKAAKGNKSTVFCFIIKYYVLLVMDLYIEIEGFYEVLFEFKLLEKETAEDAINLIFKMKYDSEFKMEKDQQEKFIIGVAIDSKKQKIIQKFKVLKYEKEKKCWFDHHYNI